MRWASPRTRACTWTEGEVKIRFALDHLGRRPFADQPATQSTSRRRGRSLPEGTAAVQATRIGRHITAAVQALDDGKTHIICSVRRTARTQNHEFDAANAVEIVAVGPLLRRVILRWVAFEGQAFRQRGEAHKSDKTDEPEVEVPDGSDLPYLNILADKRLAARVIHAGDPDGASTHRGRLAHVGNDPDDGSSFAHCIGDTKTPRNRGELAHPRGTRGRVAIVNHRVYRGEQLRSIVQREAPLRIGEPRGDGFKREREPAHIEIDPTHPSCDADRRRTRGRAPRRAPANATPTAPAPGASGKSGARTRPPRSTPGGPTTGAAPKPRRSTRVDRACSALSPIRNNQFCEDPGWHLGPRLDFRHVLGHHQIRARTRPKVLFRQPSNFGGENTPSLL